MSTAGQARLAQAQADIQAAELVIAEERKEQLKERLKAAIEEGRAIDERLKTTGAELVARRAESEPFWAKRDAISKTRIALDKDFEAKDFPSDEETEQYQSKRAALTQQWHEVTERINTLSGDIARLEEEFRQLKFARSRTVNAVNDLRNAISSRRGKNRF
jgi:septal ring factor EnvC (AmiA/AmiB activator)